MSPWKIFYDVFVDCYILVLSIHPKNSLEFRNAIKKKIQDNFLCAFFQVKISESSGDPPPAPAVSATALLTTDGC